MAEFALVSSNRIRLELLAGEGDAGAATALELLKDPNTFLSTIQVAITLIGIVAGAYSGITFAKYLTPFFETLPALAPYATAISVAIIVIATTYFSLVFGELVPKRIGLDNPEYIASRVARFLRAISVLASPLVRILSASTEGVLRVSGKKRPVPAEISEEEIWRMVSEGARTGVIEKAEETMVNAIFRLGDRKVFTLMTPRPEIVGIDLDEPLESAMKKVLSSNHSFLPVYRGQLDTLSGVVWVRDLWAQMIEHRGADISRIIRDPIIVSETAPALKLLELFRTSATPIALAIDEFGVITGVITVHDILTAIIGDIGTPGSPRDRELTFREDGSVLIDGLYPLDEVKDLFGLSRLPGEREGLFHTLAGFVMTELGRIPATGDVFEWNNLRFEVIDMDGNRIDKILVTPLQSGKDSGEDSADGT
ncbi:MAG: HlyC/CorC family transporter [Methanomicrobiales archaeon]|nr:HlyC/CorC family transporter [Methanomicrobiales archaeon]NYT21894.1 HlyC/CorC family transporter [Methanomicrobiales archaeon]